MMKQVMVRAWTLAKDGVTKFGGKVREYFATSLSIAWEELKEMSSKPTIQTAAVRKAKMAVEKAQKRYDKAEQGVANKIKAAESKYNKTKKQVSREIPTLEQLLNADELSTANKVFGGSDVSDELYPQWWALCELDIKVKNAQTAKAAVKTAADELAAAQQTLKEAQAEAAKTPNEIVSYLNEWETAVIKSTTAALTEIAKWDGVDDTYLEQFTSLALTAYNETNAEDFIIKSVAAEKERKLDTLMSRINRIVGEIKESHIRIAANGEINGIIKGAKGSASVDTVGVGGYNIVDFHFRTTVTKL